MTNSELAAGGNQHLVIQNLTKLFGQDITDIVKPYSNLSIPGRVRAADINIDGFPDLFISLEFKDPLADAEDSTFKQSYVLVNTACKEGWCPSEALNVVK